MGIQLPKKIDDTTERSEQRDFTVFDGDYLVKVLEANEKDRNDGEGTFLAVTYEILDSEKPSNEKCIGLKVFDILSMSEAAMWRIVNLLDAVYPPKFNGSEIPNDIDGKWLSIKVKNETYKGKENARVKQYHAASDWDGATMKTDGAGREILDDSKPAGGDKPATSGKAAAGTSSGKAGKGDDVSV
jgi:hypothetical protein